MSDSDGCASILVTLCCGVLAGICIDFTSIQHGCTQHLCRFSWCPSAGNDEGDYEEDERQPLISDGRCGTQQQQGAL
ncbi:hypothetical protein DFP72DRAFT_904311 [Ephemerocybe angulata]|uniref:Secreted protein n=1 Tax=Ephemerocybe angulata TaxID=980116 RepID=A0A8H6M229_9AGAR|nr:hypothetical protein DFP72DRAFT_904311 [Tulosesus angulatus]